MRPNPIARISEDPPSTSPTGAEARGPPMQGSVYEGDLVDGVPHGHGQLSQNGTLYMGQFVAGKPHGRGRMTNEVSTYDGEWCDGKPHGEGKKRQRREQYLDRLMQDNVGQRTGMLQQLGRKPDRTI